jgi:hypothetical protein
VWPSGMISVSGAVWPSVTVSLSEDIRDIRSSVMLKDSKLINVTMN